MGATKLRQTSKPDPSRSMADRRDSILKRGLAVLRAETAAIKDAETRLGESFVGAVEAILDCRGRVGVTGVGKAGLIGDKIQATLASTGTLSYRLHPVDALHGDLGMVDGGDVILSLSKSGSTELVELLPRIKELGCRIILLTARPESAAARHADYVIDIGSTEEACPLGLAPSSSTTAMLAIGDAIALSVMEQKSVQHEQYASYHPGGALGRYLLTAKEMMRLGKDCPRVRDSDTLGVCYEAILAAPRRAGAAAVVDASDRLVGIVTHGDFFRLFLAKDRSPDRPVREVMTRSPKSVGLNDRATDALGLMRKHAIDELPVVDKNGKLAGIIDIQDLLARGFSIFDAP